MPITGLTNRRKIERGVFLGLTNPAASGTVARPVHVATPPAARPNTIASRSTADLNAAELARVQPGEDA